MPQIEDWQNQPISESYPVVFTDTIHYSGRDSDIICELAGYVVLGINQDGHKEFLTIEIGEKKL